MTSTDSVSHRLCVLFSMAMNPIFSLGFSQGQCYEQDMGWRLLRAMDSANSRSGNRSCTLGPNRELEELTDNRGEILFCCKYPHKMRQPGRSAVLALKGNSVSNRQQPSQPIANS